VARFEDYVEDLQAFVGHVSELSPERPLLLLGHSNGGLIAIRAVQQGLPGVRGLVLTNPLLELRAARKPVPDALARLLSWGAGRLPLPNGVRPRDLTHEPSILRALLQDRWVHRVGTPRWYWSATLAGRAALADAGRVTLPLLAVVGELDPLVEPRGLLQFYERVASPDKQLVTRRGELHEVLNETDRRSLFELIQTWLERVCAAPPAQRAPSDSGIA
jgi:alpha-beta hydrolase superfamily lysophospholipase